MAEELLYKCHNHAVTVKTLMIKKFKMLKLQTLDFDFVNPNTYRGPPLPVVIAQFLSKLSKCDANYKNFLKASSAYVHNDTSLVFVRRQYLSLQFISWDPVVQKAISVVQGYIFTDPLFCIIPYG